MWWIFLVLSVIMFFWLVGIVLPHVFFPTVIKTVTCDRGLKNYREKNGRSIVYEPQKKFQEFISQYILSDRNGKKVIICKVSEKVELLDYDITLFNKRNKVFKVINVRELILNGYTQTLELHENTAYVSLIINYVNGNSVDNSVETLNLKHENSAALKKRERFSVERIIFFSGAVAVLVLAEVYLVCICIAFNFGDVFVLDFIKSFYAAVIAVTLSVVSFLAVFLSFYIGKLFDKNKDRRQKRI